MKKILMYTLLILALTSVGACGIAMKTFSPNRPPPKALQFTQEDLAHYCGTSTRQLRQIRKSHDYHFDCVEMFAQLGQNSAMEIAGNIYYREGEFSNIAKIYLSYVLADYCGSSRFQIQDISKPQDDHFECVLMYAQLGNKLAREIVGKAYHRVGKNNIAEYYLSKEN